MALLGFKYFWPSVFSDNGWLLSILYVLVTVYLLVLGYQIISYLITRSFGEPKTVGEKTHYADTYSSRALSLLCEPSHVCDGFNRLCPYLGL